MSRITLETEPTASILHDGAAPGWCSACGMAVEVIALDRSTLLDQGVLALIRAWLGTGKLHFLPNRNGQAQIYLPSLFRTLSPVKNSPVASSTENTTEVISELDETGRQKRSCVDLSASQGTDCSRPPVW